MNYAYMPLLFVAMGNQEEKLRTQRRARSKVRRKRRLRIKSKVDQDQDLLLEELQQENEQLQLCLGSLVQTLVEKGVLTQGELGRIIESAADIEESEAD